MKVVGYTSRLAAAPGDDVAFMVSCTEPRYSAELVRLLHGDDNPTGPGFKATRVVSAIDGEYDGHEQTLPLGSCVVVQSSQHLRLDHGLTIQLWLWPTLLDGGEQALLSGPGYDLHLDDAGRVAVTVGADTVRCAKPLTERRWFFVCASYDYEQAVTRLVVESADRWTMAEGDTAEMRSEGPAPGEVPLVLAARPGGSHYNGKLESPRLYGRALAPDEVARLRDGEAPTALDGLVAAWDFSVGMGTRDVTDIGPHGLHGRTVNMPARAMTGHAWRCTSIDPRDVPEEYAAIHFHDDDLDDAGWDIGFTLTVPGDLPSGIYAAHLQAGDDEDYVPFFVRPPRGRATAPIALVLPTFSYLAYGNEHMLTDPVNQDIFANFGTTPDYPSQPQDVYIVENRLGSLYDIHRDGSGVCYSSRLRPILNMRPKYDFMLLSQGKGAPHQLNADLHLVDWLHARGFAFDVLTDEDLHAEGAALLEPYRAVVSGSHHEYWSAPMLDGMEAYLAGGGRFVYLSGNGMYWVTGVDPEGGHTVEVRRFGVTRSWEAQPGEWHLSTTGEFGGAWRFRGRAPQRLTGVGHAAEGFDLGRPYLRQPDSFDPRAQFIFAGIGHDEAIGDFPTLVNQWGAAGYEIERFDHALGSPPHALLLASAAGFSDGFQHAIEENFASDSLQGGSVNPFVRADMCFFECPNNGAVFATGSISWCSALSYNGYDNNVSRVTENVLTAFLREGPLPC